MTDASPLPPDPMPYIAWMEAMTLASVGELGKLATPDLRFADPFHDVRGLAKVETIYRGMFKRLPEIRFQVLERAWSGRAWLITWRFEGRDRHGKSWPLDGMSRLVFAADGRLAEHVDYWDAASQIYGKIPVLGIAMRALARRAATG